MRRWTEQRWRDSTRYVSLHAYTTQDGRILTHLCCSVLSIQYILSGHLVLWIKRNNKTKFEGKWKPRRILSRHIRREEIKGKNSGNKRHRKSCIYIQNYHIMVVVNAERGYYRHRKFPEPKTLEVIMTYQKWESSVTVIIWDCSIEVFPFSLLCRRSPIA